MRRDDHDLVEQAAAGEAEAFSTLYRRYYPLVFRYSVSLTGCAWAAEDVTQDVFADLVRHLTRFDPTRAALGSYLYGIVRNLARERRRREGRLLPLSHIDTETLTALHGDPRPILEGAERSATVRRVVNALPPRFREPLLLCDLHDLRYVDAAALLGTTPAAVRYRLREGRSRLRRRLDKNLRTVSRAGVNHVHGLRPLVRSRRLPPRRAG